MTVIDVGEQNVIHVIATIELVEGGKEEFLRQFHELVPTVKQEEGCLEYGPTVDVETNISAQGPARVNVVTVVEKWESLGCLEAHLVASHMLAYRESVKPLVKSTSLAILEPS